MGAQDIITKNPQPEQTAPGVTVGTRLFVDEYNTRVFSYSTSSILGKRRVGLIDPKNVKGDIKPTMQSMEAGASVISLQEVITGYSGTVDASVHDYSTLAMQEAVGTTAGVIDHQYPSSPVNGDLATGSTKDLIQLDTGDATAFTSYVGYPIEVSSQAGEKLIAYIKSVNTANDTITPEYPLDEVPATSGTCKLLEGFVLEGGGNITRQREFIFAQDFNNGASHRTVVWRAQSTTGMQIAGQGGAIVMTPLQLKVQGHTRTVDSLLQNVPVTVFGKFGRSNVA